MIAKKSFTNFEMRRAGHSVDPKKKGTGEVRLEVVDNTAAVRRRCSYGAMVNGIGHTLHIT